MNYLISYGLSPEEVETVEKVIEKSNINKDIFEYDFEKIIEILNIFTDHGITNYFGILTTSPSLFCDTPKSIEDRLNSYGNKEELAKLINENADNLALVDLI